MTQVNRPHPLEAEPACHECTHSQVSLDVRALVHLYDEAQGYPWRYCLLLEEFVHPHQPTSCSRFETETSGL